MLTKEQIRTLLTEHRYLDRSNDLGYSLKNTEVDALCSYFETCNTDEYCNEHYLHTVADNVIRKRLGRRS